MTARQSAEVKRALKLVKGGMTAYAAAKKVGIHQSTLSRNAEYRAFVDQKKGKTEP